MFVRLHHLTAPILLVVVAACGRASDDGKSDPAPGPVCSDSYRSIEGKVPTGDAHGHGPDVGSEEWKSVIEFKLAVRGKPDVPGRDSEEWCRYIDRLVRRRDGTAE